MFRSLDFLYVPTDDVDDAAAWYVGTLGAELVWKVRAMDTVVAALRLADAGPQVLLSGHLGGERPVLVYRVDDYAAAVAALRSRGATLHELEIPHGPVAVVTGPGDQPVGVYELVRPEAAAHFDGRIDPPPVSPRRAARGATPPGSWPAP
jgi:catechol 2,3-dioxygenase-like lactoylglutathione lyase family enzyme